MEKSRFELFETEYWRAVLLNEQRYLGRSIVELKRECGDLADVTKEEILDFLHAVSKMQNLLRGTFGARMFNWACNMNDAFQKPEPKPQVHWHCIPRYDKEVSIGGEVFKDINFGHHHLKGGEGDRVVTPELHEIIFRELQKNLYIT